jgi:hypothetical protein
MGCAQIDRKTDMFLKFQELEKIQEEGHPHAHYKANGHYTVEEVQAYVVCRKQRHIVMFYKEGRSSTREIPETAHLDVFVMNEAGKTIDTITFRSSLN